MKSFFKKLAFVMALAMVVTLAAPAAAKTAYAASNITISYQNEKSTITELNIAKVGQSEDLKFNNAPKGWEKLNPTWKSSDESVATVDKNGVVTAVAAGTAVVTFTCGDQSASVKVNCVNMVNFPVTIGVASDRAMSAKTIEVGDEFDFAFYGIKDYSADRYFCSWASDDTSVAAVDQKGLVTAIKPGTAKITLIVFNKVTGQTYTAVPVVVTVPGEATATPTPTQVPDAFTVEQKTDSKVILTFTNKEITKEAVEAGLKATYYINDNAVEFPVKVDKVKDGVAEVSSYSLFTEGVKYSFTFDGETKTMEAYIGTVVSVKPYTVSLKQEGKAYVGKETYIKYDLLNDRNIVITDSAKTGTATVEVSLVNEPNDGAFWFDLTNEALWFNEAGKVAQIKVVYYTGEVNIATGERIVGATGIIPVVSTAAPVYGMVSVDWYTINGWSSDTTIAVGDAASTLRVKFVDNEGNKVWSNNTVNERLVNHFSFATTKNSVVSVNAATGQLTANAAGTANILVYYDPDLADYAQGNVVAVIPVTVVANRVVTSVNLNKSSALISTNVGLVPTVEKFNETGFKVTLKDQLSSKITAQSNSGNITIVCNNKTLPTGVNYLKLADGTEVGAVTSVNIPVSSTAGEYNLTLVADASTFSGSYHSYVYTFTVTADGKSATFSVTAKDPNYKSGSTGELAANIAQEGYDLVIGGDSDIKAKNNSDKNATATLYRVSNGVHYDIVTLQPYPAAGANGVLVNADEYNNFYYGLTKVGASGVNGDSVVNGIVRVPLSTISQPLTNLGATSLPTAVTGKALNKAHNGAGTYSVAIYKATGTPGASASALQLYAQKTVVIKDTQDVMKFAGKQQNFYTLANVAAAGATATIEDLVKESFSFKLGDATLSGRDSYDRYIDGNTYCPIEVAVDWHTTVGGAVSIPGSVIYVNKVYFYVPVDDNDGNTGDMAYVQYVINVNDYVIVK